jgi:quinone-modifying oxidoreductase, subunit QmoB
MDKIGVFLCSGCEIGEAVDLDEFEEIADDGGAACYHCHSCLCSPEGVASIKEAIDSDELDGLVIVACSQREKTAEFDFDKTKISVERVPIRELAIWPQEAGHEDTQMLAEDMLRMGLAKVDAYNLPEVLDEEMADTVLVVGGGLTGMQAAIAAAGMGHPVELIEKTDRLGGYLADVTCLVPERPPYDQVAATDIPELISRIEAHGSIKVRKSTGISSITGQPGQFQVQTEGADGADGFTVGAIVQATGAVPYDAGKLEGFGHAENPDVITTFELEKMLSNGGLKRPSNGAVPGRVLFVLCAGSRDKAHLEYCSSECCASSLKLVSAIHADHPELECVVVYKDLRAPGQLEHFYEAVQTQPGSLFTRGEVKGISANGGNTLKVEVAESLLGEDLAFEADLVVLATGMVPVSADGEAIRTLKDAQHRAEHGESDVQKEAAREIVAANIQHEGTEILNLHYRQGPDMPTLGYGFPDSHYICFPYETRRTGVYAAGTLRAPMDSAQASEDGWGAAMKAVQCIVAERRGEAVHPRAGDIGIATFELKRCTQCKRCTEECPFGTINEDEKGTPEYFALRCRRCGICLGACPERIIHFPDFSVQAVASAIKAVEVPDEDEEKPRILVFACENDALPAIEEAARRRLKWNAWMRIIPVRCLGSVNAVWVADSLSSGFDGVMLLGCKKGDDYQCHYIQGSELAATRMANQQDTLKRLALEEERIQVLEIARDDYARIPEVLDAFAEVIEDVGPNPYKGF